MPKKPKIIYRLRVQLHGVEPPIWRQIDVPDSYTFGDLHVAMQDAMGWLDCHLHQFTLKPQGASKLINTGIPDDFCKTYLPAWEVPIKRYFTEPGQSAYYDYDFGDGWIHHLLLEGILLADQDATYPCCLNGARACPPEDCGGIDGYAELLAVLRDPTSAEHDNMVKWLKYHDQNYDPFDPEAFNPKTVRFTDPRKRFRLAFGR